MDDMFLIKRYKDMKSVSQMCKDLGLHYQNVIKGQTRKENIDLIANEVKNEIINIQTYLMRFEIESTRELRKKVEGQNAKTDSL